MGDWIEPGAKAPAFSLPDQTGRKLRLSAFKGHPLVLYFYPADLTPGCTRQACAFRDCQAELEKLGALVVGVSPDPVAKHVKFEQAHGLNFPLLADTDHAVAEAYGAWREKTNYGRKYMGIQRSTYLIDGQGRVCKVWKAVRVDGHAAAVIQAVQNLVKEG